jgi:hypothetical protein
LYDGTNYEQGEELAENAFPLPPPTKKKKKSSEFCAGVTGKFKW